MATGRGRGNKPKKTVIAQRLHFVYELARDGYRFTRALQLVTLAAAKEAKDRKAAKNVADKPAEVWGDSGTVARKTFTRYWQRAHTRLIEQGKTLVKEGDLILAKNFGRQDALYARALEAGQFGVCRRLIVDQLTLFGMMGTIKAKLSSALDDEPGDQPDIQQADRTLPELIDAQFAILNGARARIGMPALPNPAMLRVERGGQK